MAMSRDFKTGPGRALLAPLAPLAPWALPVLLLAAWELSARAGWLSTRVLPEPLAVLKALWALLRSGELWQHVQVSTARAFAGLAVGGGLGLVLGLLTGSLRGAETLLDTTLQMLRNIPALALIPLVILWFGIDESAKLFLVAVGVFFPIYLNTFHGIRSVDPALIEMARSYGVSGWNLYRQVILPGALPGILVGLRFSLGLMWVLLIVAETVSAQAGRCRGDLALFNAVDLHVPSLVSDTPDSSAGNNVRVDARACRPPCPAARTAGCPPGPRRSAKTRAHSWSCSRCRPAPK
jgi:sulfonate transport system permease protein